MHVYLCLVILLNLYSLESRETLERMYNEKLCSSIQDSSEHSKEIYKKLKDCENLYHRVEQEVRAKCGFGKSFFELDIKKMIKYRCEYDQCYSKTILLPEYQNNITSFEKLTFQERVQNQEDYKKCLFQALGLQFKEGIPWH